MTTSKGFMRSFSKGKTIVDSVDNFKSAQISTSVSVNASACVGGDVGAGSVKACLNASVSSSNSSGRRESNTVSDSTRSEASFTIGLKAQGTPYEELTAGALILVSGDEQDLAAHHGSFKNAVILSGADTIVVTEDNTSYYLVSNDCFSPGNGSLTVNISQYRNSKEASMEAISKLSDLEEAINSKISSLMEVGVISQRTLNRIEKELFALAVGKRDPNTPEINNFFDLYISYITELLEYKSQVVYQERLYNDKRSRVLNLIEELEGKEADTDISSSIINNLLLSIDLDTVGTSGSNTGAAALNRVLERLDENILPLVDFWYDSPSNRNAVTKNLDWSISDISLTDDFSDVGTKIQSYVEIMLENIDMLRRKSLTLKQGPLHLEL